jgi:hypothetical protein
MRLVGWWRWGCLLLVGLQVVEGLQHGLHSWFWVVSSCSRLALLLLLLLLLGCHCTGYSLCSPSDGFGKKGA